MDWTQFLGKNVSFNMPYYAIKCKKFYSFSPEKNLIDLKKDNMYISGEVVSLELVEPQSGTLERLINRTIDVGNYILDNCVDNSFEERMRNPKVGEMIVNLCADFGMVYPQYIGILPQTTGMFQYAHMPRSMQRFGSYDYDMPYPTEIGCSLAEVHDRIMDITLVFQCLRVLGGYGKAHREWFSCWDENKSEYENISLTLASVLSRACDASVQFEFKVDKKGMPVSRMIYENPFDAALAVIGNAFITAPGNTVRPVKCQWCGAIFSASSSKAKYCSPRCRMAASRAAKKIEEANNVKTETQGE